MKSVLNMRPFQIILLVVFGLFALGGLYLFANFTGFSSGAAKVGSVVVWGTLPQDAIQGELAQISIADKSYAKVTYVQKGAATFDTDLANAIASGSGPDLILINQEQLVQEQSKISVIPFSSLPQRTFVSTYLPENSIYLTSTGTYGVPYVLDPLVLYYNKTLLASAGITAAPTSWEAVTGLAPNLTHSNGQGGLSQSAIALGGYSSIEDARGILSLLLLQGGTSITSETTAGIRSTLTQTSAAGANAPSQAVLNFYTQFADPSRTVYSWDDSFGSARQAFLGGNLVLYVGYASEEPLLKAGNPNLNFDMAAIPQPQTSATKVDYGLAYAFAIPKAAVNKAGALKTAFALADKAYVPGAAGQLSMAPSQAALLTPSATDLYAPIYYPMALIAQGWLSPAPQTVDTIFSTMITSITSGRSQTEDALYSADQALDASLPTTNQ